MTFLKRYGLSAISLNMLISAFAIQWTILVSGFFHLHYDKCPGEEMEANDSKPGSAGLALRGRRISSERPRTQSGRPRTAGTRTA